MGIRILLCVASLLWLVPATSAAVTLAPGDVVATATHGALLRVDPDTGDREVISGCVDLECSATVGSGPAFEGREIAGVRITEDGDILVVDDERILRVDPETGNRSVLAGCVDDPACTTQVGNGPSNFALSLDVVTPPAASAVSVLPAWGIALLAGVLLGLNGRRVGRGA